MAVASSPIPGLCFSMCAFVDAHAPSPPCSLTYLLLATVESFCLCPVSWVGFLPLIYSSILSSLWPPLPPHLLFNSLPPSFFLLHSLSLFFPAPQPCINSSCKMIIPRSSSSPPAYFSLIECQLWHFSPLSSERRFVLDGQRFFSLSFLLKHKFILVCGVFERGWFCQMHASWVWGGGADVLNRAFDTHTRGSDMLSRVMYVKDDCPQ